VVPKPSLVLVDIGQEMNQVYSHECSTKLPEPARNPARRDTKSSLHKKQVEVACDNVRCSR